MLPPGGVLTHNPLPGPGWHADPHQPGLLRYWDGQAWTSHTSPVPPAPAVAAPARRSRARTWWTVAVVVLLALVGVGALSEEDPPRASTSVTAADSTPSPTTEPAAEPEEPSPSEEPEPETADVPRLVGVDRDEAEELLDASGLTIGSVKQVWSMRPSGTVLEQGVRAGAAAHVGSAVALVIAKAIPPVPGTVGRLRSAAVSALTSAGYRVIVTSETVTTGTTGAVLRQSPVGGTRVKPGGTIRLLVANVVRPVVQAPASNCTPGYDPCLAPASDHDRAGGSGDGPGYTGPVRVTGSDPYQLDSDGDGVACTG